MKKYSFDPPVIRVKQGSLVELEISTRDVQHGFDIPALGIKEPIQKGRPARVRFQADRKGEYRIQCGIVCGPGHDEMTGRLIVE